MACKISLKATDVVIIKNPFPAYVCMLWNAMVVVEFSNIDCRFFGSLQVDKNVAPRRAVAKFLMIGIRSQLLPSVLHCGCMYVCMYKQTHTHARVACLIFARIVVVVAVGGFAARFTLPYR